MRKLDEVRALAIPLLLREAAADRRRPEGPVAEKMRRAADRLDEILAESNGPQMVVVHESPPPPVIMPVPVRCRRCGA